MSTPRVPLHPKHPDRICWGCDKYCPADDMACGNGTIRTPHPIELFGEDWIEWADERSREKEVGKLRYTRTGSAGINSAEL